MPAGSTMDFPGDSDSGVVAAVSLGVLMVRIAPSLSLRRVCPFCAHRNASPLIVELCFDSRET